MNSLLPNGYSGESCKKQWYVVYAKSRQEAVAEENLGRQGYEVYLPLIAQPRRQRGQWRQVLEPLFPRYFFVHLRLGCDNIGPIRYTTGVSSLVRFREELAVVADSIVESLRHRVDCIDGVHFSKAPAFTPGEMVVIDAGPMAGVEAIFQAETGAERVVILVNLLGRKNYISVDRDLLLMKTTLASRYFSGRLPFEVTT